MIHDSFLKNMPHGFPDLKKALGLCVQKPGHPRSASIACSQSGQCYAAGAVASDTHLLDITSEQAALVLASGHADFAVRRIATITETEDDASVSISPLVLKLLIDHERRTGVPITYSVYGMTGNVLFEATTPRALCPYYEAPIVPLQKTRNGRPGQNSTRWEAAKETLQEALKKAALQGSERAFTTHDAGSRYGASVATKSGMVYFGGQYSGFEKRIGLHAEMNALIAALMDGGKDITHIGVVSDKYPDSPCPLCGCCRQFIAELSQKYGITPLIYSFAKENHVLSEHTLEELLPDGWKSA